MCRLLLLLLGQPNLYLTVVLERRFSHFGVPIPLNVDEGFEAEVGKHRTTDSPQMLLSVRAKKLTSSTQTGTRNS